MRYGSTSELVATLLEEGEYTPADVFISQDAAALGALSRSGRLREDRKHLTFSPHRFAGELDIRCGCLSAQVRLSGLPLKG